MCLTAAFILALGACGLTALFIVAEAVGHLLETVRKWVEARRQGDLVAALRSEVDRQRDRIKCLDDCNRVLLARAIRAERGEAAASGMVEHQRQELAALIDENNRLAARLRAIHGGAGRLPSWAPSSN